MNIIIIDFEATCWRGHPEKSRNETEIIEIGLVVHETSCKISTGAFETFVRPSRNPELDKFCMELTGITQEKVECAPLFIDAHNTMYNIFASFGYPPWASWDDFDKRQWKRDCRWWELPDFTMRHINLKTVFNWQYKEKVGVVNALKFLGLEFEGTNHRALADAKNAARICNHLDIEKFIKENK
jgi:inhibitor of KinA sporulation pathway (predicted exonuclease)